MTAAPNIPGALSAPLEPFVDFVGLREPRAAGGSYACLCCSRSFRAVRANQFYCSAACKQAEAAFRRTYGPGLMDALIAYVEGRKAPAGSERKRVGDEAWSWLSRRGRELRAMREEMRRRMTPEFREERTR